MTERDPDTDSFAGGNDGDPVLNKVLPAIIIFAIVCMFLGSRGPF